MRPGNDVADHHVFIVMIGGEMAKDTLSHAVFTLAAQTLVHVFPVPETARKITPGDACTIAIQHSFYEKTVACSSTSDMTPTTRKKVFYPLSLVVTSAIAPHLFLSLKTGKTVSTGQQKDKPHGTRSVLN